MGFEYNASGQIIKESLNDQPLIHSYDTAGIRNKLEGAHTPLGLHWQQGQLNIGSHPVVPIECDLRYQGQIYDKETGLYYNRHRYYDTDSGQYLSPDPIGMAGGLRP